MQILEGLTLSIPNGIWLTKIEQLSFEKISNDKGVLTFFRKPENANDIGGRFLKVHGNVLRSAAGNPLTTYVKILREVSHFKKVYLHKISAKLDKNVAVINFALHIQLR